ncbi:hypothetical protein JL09_g568 [Pichia kudriavzevii]|uniref:Uncharacterized protein n=1 Tax=Pichia kudriavzevii TaxID=4909 RepID=A0A099P7L9_PICKU|nr:hypothetical protein JL09_g568 [Pichia kudriavzevii]
MNMKEKSFGPRQFKGNLQQHKQTILKTVLFLGLIWLFFCSYQSQGSSISKPSSKKFQKFFKKYFNELDKAIVHGDKLMFGTRANAEMENIYADVSETELKELEDFSPEIIKQLKVNHRKIVSFIPKEIHVEGYCGSGYVTIGGGNNDYKSMLLIKQLRETGAKYPIEVIIPPFYEPNLNLCDNIFPSYDATCVSMNGIFGKKNLQKLRYNSKLIGTLAIIASSFENALFISPDTIPLHNPDHLFEGKVISQFGLIVWPSVYRTSITPSYYEISDIQVENNPVRILNDRWVSPEDIHQHLQAKAQRDHENTQLSFHDLKGTSSDYAATSDLLLINKRKNLDVLLLMLYYTNDGPSRYFPLLNAVSSKGNGDYIVAAAHYFKKPYYQLFKTADKIGEEINSLTQVTSITGHYDPNEDYELLKGNLLSLFEQRRELKNDFKYDYFEKIRRPFNVFTSTPLFFHVEETLHPFKMKNSKVYKDNTGNQRRIFGNHIKFYGCDFELKLITSMNELLCGAESTDFTFAGFENVDVLCSDYIQPRMEFLQGNSKQFWNKYVFEKRPPNSVPQTSVSTIEKAIKEGFDRDVEYQKDEPARPSILYL